MDECYPQEEHTNSAQFKKNLINGQYEKALEVFNEFNLIEYEQVIYNLSFDYINEIYLFLMYIIAKNGSSPVSRAKLHQYICSTLMLGVPFAEVEILAYWHAQEGLQEAVKRNNLQEIYEIKLCILENFYLNPEGVLDDETAILYARELEEIFPDNETIKQIL